MMKLSKLGRKLKPEEKNIIDELYWKMQNKEQKKDFLRNYTKKFIIDQAFVDDVIQTTFLIACEKIDKLLESPNQEGYIMRILQNTIKNFNRVRNSVTQMLALVSQKDWLENYVEAKEDEDDLDFLYGDLVKYKEYELLKKFAVEGKSVAEIAAELGISEGACKSRIFKAKRKLKNILESRK